MTASVSSSTGFAASFKSLKSYKVPDEDNDVLRWQELSALVGSGIQGTGNPPLQGYNKGSGTIETRLKGTEDAMYSFYRSYRNRFRPEYPRTDNNIKIKLSLLPNADVSTLLFVMIAILDRSTSRYLPCCMTIGGGGVPTTGYFITGVGTVSGIEFLQSETVSCTYSNNVYTLTGPSDKISTEYKYDLLSAAVLRIN